MKRIRCIDSHTAGEPTRVVLDGIPDLGPGTVAERCARFRDHFDWFRSLCVDEPRGSDILVGALFLPPNGVIFFNNVSTLNMCGHGTIGLMVTLAHLGMIAPGTHTLETPVGPVAATLHDRNRVSVQNVPSWREHQAVPVDVPGLGRVTGDVAWGGNWFFLCHDHGQTIERRNVKQLTTVSQAIRDALQKHKLTGRDGAEIDHIELTGPAGSTTNHGRNFVLCPGGVYDRSPCGTGTSAKLACLAAEGKWKPDDVWRQESVLGTVFEGTYQTGPERTVIPTITGTAYVTAELTLCVDPNDSFSNSGV